MLQRIQTIYLGIYIALSVFLITGSSIIQFDLTFPQAAEPLKIHLNTLHVQVNGQLNLNAEEKEEFSSFISESRFSWDESTQKLAVDESSPLFIVQILLLLFAILTLASYKRLKRQIQFSRALIFLTVLYFIGTLALYSFSNGLLNSYTDELRFQLSDVNKTAGLGFYLVCALVPFAILAYLGIRRDLELIKSVDRIR